MRVGIAIPTINEEENLKTILPYFVKKGYEIIVISDDLSKDGTVRMAKRYGAYVPYHAKKLGLGQSWKEAITIAWHTFDCDIVVCMDADHNPKVIPMMLAEALDGKFDVIVGNELGKWKLARKVTAVLCQYLLGIYVAHPTCGFIIWNKRVLDRIPWKHVRSKGDMFHVELLWWAIKAGFVLGEYPIPKQPGKRMYGLRRIARWLWEFFRVLRLKYLWFWRWKTL